MFKKTIGLGLVALLGATAGCGGGQQSVGCPVQNGGSWAVKYELKNEAQKDTPCGTLVGEQMFMQRYNDIRDPDAGQHVAIRPIGIYSENGPTGAMVGALESEPTNGECKATSFTEGKLADGSVKYKLENVVFQVTPTAPGSMFTGDLTYTSGSCTAQYTVTGVWPALPCADDGDCTPGTPLVNPDFDLKCATLSNPAAKRCVTAKAFPSLR